MSFFTRFVYDLTGYQIPQNAELDEEIDRLLFLNSAEEPNFVATAEELDANNGQKNSEVVSLWLRRKFEPVLIRLLLQAEGNYKLARSELVKMERYKTWIEKIFRPYFLETRAVQRLRDLCFDQLRDDRSLQEDILGLKKTLTLLANHLTSRQPNLFLLPTTRYTTADITLYNYLKRIVVGGYKDYGLKSHIMNSDSLVKFMTNYAALNTYVTPVVPLDLLDSEEKESSILKDLSKPAVFAMAVIFFYLWRHGSR